MRGRFNGRVVGQDYTGRNTRHNGRAGMYNAVQSAFAPSLDITLANGLGPLFTYTRATTATVKDFEGLIKNCLSGELRIQGARRVQNLQPTSSGDFSNAVWQKTATGAGTSPSQVSGNTYRFRTGGTTASDASQIQSNAVGTSIPSGSTCTVSITLSASAPVTLVWLLPTSSIDLGRNINVTTTPQRFSFTVSNGTGTTVSQRLIAKGDVSGNVDVNITLADAQIENVTGQANQNPSEYVSVGVTSSPNYHGYFADGIRYFSYANGNTVSGSNVVTEAQGAALTGTIGYLAEGARTNLLLQGRDLSDASWTKDNCTITANAATGVDGTSSMDAIVEDATAGAVHRAYSTAINFTSGTTYAVAFDLKKGARDYCQLALGTGAFPANCQAYFNLNTGAVVSTGAGAVSASIETTGQAGVYRCVLIGTANATASTNLFVNPSADGTTNTFNGVNGQTAIYADYGGVETGAFPSSRIATTTASVARNADVLTCPSAGIVNDSAGWAVAEVVPIGSVANGRVVGFVNGGAGALLLNSLDLRVFDGTTYATAGLGALTVGSASKIGSTWGGSTMQAFKDGAAGSSQAFDGSMGATGVGIGIDSAAGGTNGFVIIKRVQIGTGKQSAAKMQALTS